jgi:hypothetical protein
MSKAHWTNAAELEKVFEELTHRPGKLEQTLHAEIAQRLQEIRRSVAPDDADQPNKDLSAGNIDKLATFLGGDGEGKISLAELGEVLAGVDLSEFNQFRENIPFFIKIQNEQNSLPVHELSKDKVQEPYSHIRPLPNPSGCLPFSAWSLAHAVKKAALLGTPDEDELKSGAFAFLMEYMKLFDFKTKPISLKHGITRRYVDFISKTLTGSVGEGMALLFLQQKGYAYVGRFESIWRQRAATQNRQWPKENRRAPDFIAENSQQEWVLAESKGAFSSAARKPNIKSALKDGLDQLEGWDRFITPQPIKSFAIGTFLRETGAPASERSVVAFVDPAPELSENSVEFAPDTVRRANYAACLSLMGLHGAASRLQEGVGVPKPYEFPILTIAKRQYAVILTPREAKSPSQSSRETLKAFKEWRRLRVPWARKGGDVRVIGLDVNVLHALSLVTKAGIVSELMALQPTEPQGTPIDLEFGEFHGSILSDGSLMGDLTLPGWEKPFPEFKWVKVEI